MEENYNSNSRQYLIVQRQQKLRVVFNRSLSINPLKKNPRSNIKFFKSCTLAMHSRCDLWASDPASLVKLNMSGSSDYLNGRLPGNLYSVLWALNVRINIVLILG